MEWTARIVLVSCFSVPVRFSFSHRGYYPNVLDWFWKIGSHKASKPVPYYLKEIVLP